MSTDNGLTWSYVNFPGAAVLATCAPNNPNVVFGQRWLNFIHYTDDGGASTWEEVQGQHYPMTQKISISPHDTRIAFLGTKRENAPNDTVMWKWNFENGKFEGHPYFKNIAQTNINDILPFPLAGARGNYVWAGGSSKSVYSFALDSTESEDVDDSTDEEGNIEFGPVTKGLWRSSDAGLNWSYLKKVGGSGGSGDKNIIALAFAIVPPDTFLYAITKKSKGKGVRVWRSKNFGEDWGSAMSVIQKNTVTHVRTLKVHPTTPTTLVAGTDNGFAYSDDGGFTWEIRNTGMNERDIYQLAFTPSGDTIFAATYSSLFRTTDFGMNWQHIPPDSLLMQVESVAGCEGVMLSVFKDKYPGISSFNNGHWEFPSQIANYKMYGIYYRRFKGMYVSINPHNPNYAYMFGDSAGRAVLYVRQQANGNWRRTKVNEYNDGVLNTRLNVILPDPKTGSSRVYAGGTFNTSYNFMWSTDFGNTWSGTAEIGDNGSEDPVLCLAIDTSSGIPYAHTLYVGLGNNKGLYKSSDGGSTWTNIFTGYNVRSITLNPNNSTTAQVVYVSGDSLLWKSIDGFANYSTLSAPFWGAHRLLSDPGQINSTNVCWAITGDQNILYKTINGGTSWDSINTSYIPKPLTDLRSDAKWPDFIYIASAGGVFKSNPPPSKPLNIHNYYDDYPNIPTEGVHPKIIWNSIEMRDFQTFKVYKVRNGVGPTLVATTTDTIYEDVHEYIGLEGGEEIPAFYFVQAIDNHGNVSASSDSIHFILTIFSEAKIRTALLHESPREYSLSYNYPNPFNPTTLIKYSLPVSSHVKISVFDLLGKEIEVLVNQIQVEGLYEISFDASSYPSGVFLYRIIANGIDGQQFSAMKKMILTK